MRPDIEKLRSITEKELRACKGIVDAAIDVAGGIKVVAARCRSSGSQLSKYANFCHPCPDGKSDVREVFVPLDIAIEIDRAAKAPLILSVYADILGFELVPKSSDDVDDVDEMDAHQVNRKAVALAGEIFAATEDGVVDARERKDIAGKTLQLIRYAKRVLRQVL